MEYLNEEMDDLFRKAGEKYPLRTSGSNWDGVLGHLQSGVGKKPYPVLENEKKKNNKNRRFFWLLLLLPLMLVSLNYFSRPEGNKNKKPTTYLKASKSFPNAKTNPSPDKVLVVPDNTLSENTNRTHSSGGLNVNNRNPGEIKTENALAGRTQTDTKKQPSLSAGYSSGNDLIASNASSGRENSTSPKATNKGDTATGNNKAKPVTPNQKNKKSEKKSSSKEKRIYISLLAGPDFSTVKFQPVKNAGYSIGLLLGYRFNKNISAETGIFWDKKQYYSDGDYFNKSKTGIPDAVDITDLNGTCNMFEIPVSFRYDFSFNRKGRFFSTAGLSTYIMQKENYYYNAQYYGSSWSREASYNHSGNNLFSILQLSAGYEYKWGKIGRIRIEPYLKIPFAGVGIGGLPISSAGIRLGITHSFR